MAGMIENYLLMGVAVGIPFMIVFLGFGPLVLDNLVDIVPTKNGAKATR